MTQPLPERSADILTDCPDGDPYCEVCTPLTYTPTHRGEAMPLRLDFAGLSTTPTSTHRSL